MVVGYWISCAVCRQEIAVAFLLACVVLYFVIYFTVGLFAVVFFFQAEDGIRDAHKCLEFRRVLFRSPRRDLGTDVTAQGGLRAPFPPPRYSIGKGLPPRAGGPFLLHLRIPRHACRGAPLPSRAARYEECSWPSCSNRSPSAV